MIHLFLHGDSHLPFNDYLGQILQSGIPGRNHMKKNLKNLDLHFQMFSRIELTYTPSTVEENAFIIPLPVAVLWGGDGDLRGRDKVNFTDLRGEKRKLHSCKIALLLLSLITWFYLYPYVCYLHFFNCKFPIQVLLKAQWFL